MLYRNLMDVCQIWCEEREGRLLPSQIGLRDAGAERRQGWLGKALGAGPGKVLGWRARESSIEYGVSSHEVTRGSGQTEAL